MKKIKPQILVNAMNATTIVFLVVVMILESVINDGTLGKISYVISILILIGYVLLEWKMYSYCLFENYIQIFQNKKMVIVRTTTTKDRKRKSKKSNTIEMNQIVKYGYSVELLGEALEIYAGGNPSFEYAYEITEIFVQIKDGRKIPIEFAQYGKRQQKKICRYIYEATGLEPEGKLREMLL